MEDVDVLIVGAGLSGIGAACLLHKNRPGTSFVILESRDAIGGTWDLFRYPGVRSDSDMFTLGYSFRPWPEARAIADGPSIRDYIRATAAESDLEAKIRFRHRVVSADWDSAAGRWTVNAVASDSGEPVRFTCRWLSVCSGYFNYEHGHQPAFPGQERFTGPVIHPQHWPADLDWTGKRVVVIGSGATAVTLVPSLAERARHVTMLQRTPSYVLDLPSEDRFARLILRALPSRFAHPILRWTRALLATAIYQFSQRYPGAMRARLRRKMVGALPPGFDVDTHFNPPYKPWDQRMCLVPDGDLMKALSGGTADILTDQIVGFTETGIELQSGRSLEADIIVAATGLSLLAFGGISLSVDGVPVELPKTVLYKGMMLSGVPNFNFVFGYINNSWTLRADLISKHVIRLLDHMQENGYASAVPRVPASVRADLPFIDLKSGYVTRGLEDLPRQGPAAPWRMHHTYARDHWLLQRAKMPDKEITFTRG